MLFLKEVNKEYLLPNQNIYNISVSKETGNLKSEVALLIKYLRN